MVCNFYYNFIFLKIFLKKKTKKKHAFWQVNGCGYYFFSPIFKIFRWFHYIIKTQLTIVNACTLAATPAFGKAAKDTIIRGNATHRNQL